MLSNEEGCWPDKFIYVVTVGAAAATNLGPLRSAGFARVAGMMILCAAENHENPSADDKRNAIDPTSRLRYYAHTIGIPKEMIRVVKGHPDSFGDWMGALNEAGDWAGKLKIDVVFNMTGGRKSSAFGALLGYRTAEGRVSPTLISVDLFSPNARLLQLEEGGGFLEVALPVERGIDLNTYLASYGFTERDRLKREEKVKRMLALGELSISLFNGATFKGFANLYKAFGDRSVSKQAVNALRSGGVAIIRNLDNHAVELLLRANAKNKLPGFDLGNRVDDETEAKISDEFALRFLTGGWLETYILHQLEKIRNLLGPIEIVASMDIGIAGRPRVGSRSLTEFDVLIYGNDRLDLVEIKSVVSPNGLKHEAIDKLAQYKNQLTGQGGRAWLVAPLVDLAPNDPSDMIAHAKSVGIELLMGKEAVKNLVDSVVKSRTAEVR